MKANSMKIGVMLLASSLALGTVSCKKKGCTDPTANNYSDSAKKDDGSCTYDEEPTTTTQTITKAGSITANETWTANNIYKIVGKVVVEDGVTLTIEAGTIIKGEQGTGTLASALVVAQGGKVNAVGTASAPIIFTSILDNIQPGQLTGTNLDENDAGLWGGVIICGRAPISAADGDVLAQIEGIPVDDSFGAYGGSIANDNSGTLSYVSIRHGGAVIGAGNEINGLTLGGVGSGTTINNIEIIANLDDGIEFFGGTVAISNILIGYQGDDGLDIDQNFAGSISDFWVVNGTMSDESLEIDGPEGTTNVNGLFTLTNGTCNSTADLKDKAQGTFNNIVLTTPKVRASYQNDCVDPKTDAFTHLTAGSPTLVFNNSQFSTVSVYTASTDNAGVNACTVPTVDQTSAEGVAISTTATGSNTSSYSWTWMSVNGHL